jgi:hypothetical protein
MINRIMEEIIKNRILPESNYNWSELKGGTDSTVGVIGTLDSPHMFVVKSNTPERIAAETRFYQIYQKIPLLPKIKYVDPTHRYCIYDYIPGATNYNRKKKRELMSELIKHMIQYYVHPVSSDDYEWIEDPRVSLRT